MNSAADVAWLAKLHDIVEPPAPALWPPAPGWWLVTALVVLLLMRGAHWVWRRWRANAYRRMALRALAQCESDDAAASVAACLNLLRQACLALAPPPERIDWLAWLQARCPGGAPSVRVQQLLLEGAYWPPQRLTAADATELRAYVRRWLKAHRA